MSFDKSKTDAFSFYAEKHELYSLFQKTISRLLIARPTDPYQYLIDAFAKKTHLGIVFGVETITRQYDVVYICVGTLLEKAHQKQTSIGIQARISVEKGHLVSDHIIIPMVIQALREPEVAEKGFLLDGFPRNKTQAQALLEAGFIPEHILDIQLDDDKILHGALGLRLDPVTHETLNIQHQTIARSPLVTARLVVKVSDTLPVVKERLSVYRKNYASVMNCFNASVRQIKMADCNDINIIQDIQYYLGLPSVTKAPRSIRLILAGLPGSGKTTAAEQLSKEYGCIVVSPLKVMLQQISAGNGENFIAYLEQPDMVPTDLILEPLVNRLKQKDCQDNGWVLDGFPAKTEDVGLLKKSRVEPNRVVWLSATQSTCWTRLLNRRYDPESSRAVNLKAIPKDLEGLDFSKWIKSKKDVESVLEVRFNESETLEKELKKVYGIKSQSNPTGLFHSIQSEGVGEENEFGVIPSAETVFELIQGHIIRPIPSFSK